MDLYVRIICDFSDKLRDILNILLSNPKILPFFWIVIHIYC
jgi:hypothetical protein